MAYSLFLFMRDVADDDFVGWIDLQLGAANPQSPDRLAACREAVIGPLRNLYGVADKGVGDGVVVLSAQRRQATTVVARSRRDVRSRRHIGPHG
jgi:hypothetical protein